MINAKLDGLSIAKAAVSKHNEAKRWPRKKVRFLNTPPIEEQRRSWFVARLTDIHAFSSYA
jgi:hypothetical protein